VAHAEIVGLYPVSDVDSCYLVEVVIRNAETQPDFGEFTQSTPNLDRSEWQVPYDEKLLDANGEEIVADLFFDAPEPWPSDARVAFFFHELRVDEPLRTPYGEVVLPTPSPRPARLDALEYETP
jgi:hypothetical protein